MDCRSPTTVQAGRDEFCLHGLHRGSSKGQPTLLVDCGREKATSCPSLWLSLLFQLFCPSVLTANPGPSVLAFVLVSDQEISPEDVSQCLPATPQRRTLG
mmetsp:Transcript_27543/g.41648  ORF Transcript_27543/g.41648 Transcript_27543/m.41648 type:complete len:100 (+) Transcript_27543:184-483(+)